jgi:hypothetical protein
MRLFETTLQIKTPSPFDDRALNTDGVYTTHQYLKD